MKRTKRRQALIRIRGRKYLICAPTPEYGHTAFELMASYRAAQEEHARLLVVHFGWIANPGLLKLRPKGVTWVERRSLEGFVLTGYWIYLGVLGWIQQEIRQGLKRRSNALMEPGAAPATRFPLWRDEKLTWVVKRLARHGASVRSENLIGQKSGKPVPSPRGGTYARYFRRRLVRPKVPVAFPEAIEDKTRERAEQLGLRPGGRWVVLHVREAGYKRGREVSEKANSLRDETARNAHVRSYYPAIEHLVGQGYQVVRIGDKSMRPLVKEGVIDLACSVLRTPELELWCLKNASFLIGCESGPYHVAYLLGTDCLIVNCTDPICSYPVREGCLYLMKKIRDKLSGHSLGIDDMLTKEYFVNLRNTEKYDYIDNTQEELTSAVAEMLRAREAWGENTPEQERYLQRLRRGNAELVNELEYVSKWGMDEDFIGAGRLVQFQAQEFCGEPGTDQESCLAFTSIGASVDTRVGRSMKYLLVLEHIGYVRHFPDLIDGLASRGHSVHIAVDRFPQEERIVDQITLATLNQAKHFCEKYPGLVTLVPSAQRPSTDVWSESVRLLRRYRDYVRYFDPRYAKDSKLSERAKEWTPQPLILLSYLLPLKWNAFRALFDRFLAWLEDGVPVSSKVTKFLMANNFDAVIVSPLVHPPGSSQTDYLKSARRLGIRSCVCVASWDNLTNKGLMRLEPDRVTVWNEFQREEAIAMHGVSPERVVVTGAQTFDQWFHREPSRDRETFCRELGLDPAKPIVLYCCSSGFIAPNEPEFIRRWMDAVRGSNDPLLREASLLIRPHPKSLTPWLKSGTSLGRNIAVWPVSDAGSSTEGGRYNYFDSLYHSSSVIGLNTSAFVEASILGKAVHTILDDKYRDTQEGTLHFHMLTNEDRGALLYTARGFEQHLRLLAGTLKDPEAARERCRAFLQCFVRPRGLETPAAHFMIEAALELPHVPLRELSKQSRIATACLALPVAVHRWWLENIPKKKIVKTKKKIPFKTRLKKRVKELLGYPLPEVSQT